MYPEVRHSMSDSPVSCVAFQGGGALGIAHLGAWRVLAQRFRIIGVSGTSAGSIVAALCGAGYEPNHAIDVFKNLQWPEFVQRQNWLNLLSRRDGWANTERFYRWMQERLRAYAPSITQPQKFQDLFERTGIYLAITSTDINDRSGESVVFDHQREPGCDVAFAVRASIAIPGFFAPVPRIERNQMLVDGGLLMNLPVELLRSMAESKECPLIGVRFDQPTSYLDNPNILDVLRGSLASLVARGNLPIGDFVHYIDVKIDVTGYQSLDFNLTPQEKDDLIQRGVRAAELSLAAYDLQIEKARLQMVQSGQDPIASRTTPSSSLQTNIQNPSPVAPIFETDRRQSNPEAAIRSQKLTRDEVQELVPLLLNCSVIVDRDSRKLVLTDLSSEIAQRIPYHAVDRIHVTSIVTTCANFPGGLHELMTVLENYEGDTGPMQSIKKYMQTKFI